MIVKHRNVHVKNHRKSVKHTFYRIVYPAVGKRLLRSYRIYSQAQRKAGEAAKLRRATGRSVGTWGGHPIVVWRWFAAASTRITVITPVLFDVRVRESR